MPHVRLPVMPPVEPMLATSVPEIPTAPGMSYEPKWDGFRTIIFRDGDEVELVSRGGKTMTRYFPEVVAQALAQLPPRCVVDGEIVLVFRAEGRTPKLEFELLQQRIHPAASRVTMLAAKTGKRSRGERPLSFARRRTIQSPAASPQNTRTG